MGLQVAGSVYNKAYRGYSEPRNNSKKTKVKISPAGKGVLNPLTFGLKVVQSKQAQEATGELIDGSLKLLQATLEEGKKSKVSIPRRVDSRTGQVTTKAVSVGPGELFQVGLFQEAKSSKRASLFTRGCMLPEMTVAERMLNPLERVWLPNQGCLPSLLMLILRPARLWLPKRRLM